VNAGKQSVPLPNPLTCVYPHHKNSRFHTMGSVASSIPFEASKGEKQLWLQFLVMLLPALIPGGTLTATASTFRRGSLTILTLLVEQPVGASAMTLPVMAKAVMMMEVVILAVAAEPDRVRWRRDHRAAGRCRTPR
jgi:hypothetical protein